MQICFTVLFFVLKFNSVSELHDSLYTILSSGVCELENCSTHVTINSTYIACVSCNFGYIVDNELAYSLQPIDLRLLFLLFFRRKLHMFAMFDRVQSGHRRLYIDRRLCGNISRESGLPQLRCRPLPSISSQQFMYM